MNKAERKAEEKGRDKGKVERESEISISRGITEIGLVKKQVRVAEMLRPGWFLCDEVETVAARWLGGPTAAVSFLNFRRDEEAMGKVADVPR